MPVRAPSYHMNGSGTYEVELSGNWQVVSAPLDMDDPPGTLSFSDALTIPGSTHLQPFLYPERPYWGAHVRSVNTHAWFYRVVFAAPSIPYRRARLRFEGVDYFADVWLNNQYIGAHEGSFVPFVLDVTDALRSATDNVLMVRVAAPWDVPNPRGTYPTDHVTRGLVKGLYEHGEGVVPPDVNPLGIWRPVSLIMDQGISLDHARIRTEADGTVQVCFTLDNATGDSWQGALAVDIKGATHDGPGTATVIPVELPPGKHLIEHSVTLSDPRLWWSWDQGLPNLYALTADLMAKSSDTVSRLTDTFGVRTIRLERSPAQFTYFLNDRPIFLRGSSYIPGLYLSQCTEQKLAHDLSLARQANLNLLRIHVHVSPPALYDLCDRMGILIWQDFELNWIQSASIEFEERARVLQHDMIATLGNHPSIITWTCHNEPTMLVTRRDNLEKHPDLALYADAKQQDPTRPVFLCSGQMEDDWERSGDTHSYYGALWTKRYTDVYQHQFRLNTEFGFEAPAAASTLKLYSDCWERLSHLEQVIEPLWAYQAQLIQYHVEHFRRLRSMGCAGYIHFCLVDMVPQVGCGVLDFCRLPKGGYAALQRGSEPLHIALEHDGKRPLALWVFNDTPHDYPALTIRWRIMDPAGNLLLTGKRFAHIAANASRRVMDIDWTLPPNQYGYVELLLSDDSGTVLSRNTYERPFQPLPRPGGYPWKFDRFLGVKVFDLPGAESLANQNKNPLVQLAPLPLRETLAEWVLRQRLSPELLSIIATCIDFLMPGD